MQKWMGKGRKGRESAGKGRKVRERAGKNRKRQERAGKGGKLSSKSSNIYEAERNREGTARKEEV